MTGSTPTPAQLDKLSRGATKERGKVKYHHALYGSPALLLLLAVVANPL
jgi:hypothetical protein